MTDAEQLEKVTKYKYLGRLVTPGKMSTEIGQRISSGWRRLGEYSHFLKDINRSINQSSTKRDSQVSVQQQNRGNSSVNQHTMGHDGIYAGKGQIKGMYLQIFLKGSGWNGWTDRQRQVVSKRLVQEWKAFAPVLVLTLGTDTLLSSTCIAHLVQLVLTSVSFKINCPTWPHFLPI